MFENFDVYVDLKSLQDLGLTDEEIEGYFLFFQNTYQELSKNEHV